MVTGKTVAWDSIDRQLILTGIPVTYTHIHSVDILGDCTMY